MANTISNTRVDTQLIKMSNGLTSVFIEVICLAGASMAVENYQKELLLWFAQREAVSVGNAGFDLVEIAWKPHQFEEQKAFILQVLNLAQKRTLWELLPYEPQEMVLQTLVDFSRMITSFNKENISPDDQIEIFAFDQGVPQYEICPQHKIYKQYSGCIICLNTPIA